MPSRHKMLLSMSNEIRSQILRSGKEIELLTDDGEGTVGAKRQRLIEKAKGEYVVFVDDDDRIDHNYLSYILKALESKPDVVGFCGIITINGRNARRFMISKDYDYIEKKGVYYRYNNHICPVKREIALKVGYNDIGYGEDYDYATRLRPHIHTEVFIDQNIYFYKYIHKK
jgi:glycosyltransferase involved in cell wall biosynthesis